MPLNPHAVSLIPLPTGKVNLNAGTLSPTPAPIFDRAEELRRRTAANPSDFCWRQMPALLESSRDTLAHYLHCPANELLLLPNVTYAINMVVASLDLPPGAEILLTDHEYGSMAHLWNRWSAVRGWKLRTLAIPASRDLTAAALIDLFSDAMTPSTRVIFLSHCASPTGLVFPLQEICALARRREILSIVDGAHAPGMLPLDLTGIGADFYGANTHKWLMGPNNGGFLHVAPAHRLDLLPLLTAWGWDYKPAATFEDSGNGGSRWQWNLEFHGTVDRVPQMLMPEQLAFRHALGGESAIHAHMRSLSDYVRKVIPLPCASPDDPALCGAITIFNVPPCDAVRVRNQMYAEHDIECPVTVMGERRFLRICAAVFNKESDIDELAVAVKKMEVFRSAWVEK